MFSEIIPTEFFARQSEWLLWVLGAGAIGLLVLGADRAVAAAARLAAAMGMSKVIIGATVVSLGTTSPEAAVSVNAALQGDGGMALGNAVGSVICDTALIFGLCCLLAAPPKNRFVLNRHGWLQFGAGVLLTALCLVMWAVSGDIHNVLLPRAVGMLLLVLLASYLYLSVRWSRGHPEILPEEAVRANVRPDHRAGHAVASLAVVAIGLAMVVGGSEVLIGAAKEVCQRREVPPAVIAVTFVAFGTSLPELVTGLVSVLRGHADIMVGNIIGADILNVLFVTGASAAAVPLKVPPIFFYLLLPVMLLVLAMLRVFIFLPGDRFRRWMGLPLLATYVVFTIVTVWLGVYH